MYRLFSILKSFYGYRRQNQAGFSLLEMSIVLIVIGTLTGMMLPLLMNRTLITNRTLTRQHQQDIFYSLAAYLLAGNSLPCPADPAALDADFGFARNECQAPEKAVGIVPFRTLGLPAVVAQDGYHRFFTYAVEPKLTCEPDDFKGGKFEDRFRDSYCKIPGHKNSKAGHLRVKNAEGDWLIGDNKEGIFNEEESRDFIAVVILSHGEAGHGAFICNHSLDRLQALKFGAGESQNAKEDLVFVDQPYSNNPENLFRHFIGWVTHKNLVAIYGHTPCKVDPRRTDPTLLPAQDRGTQAPASLISEDEAVDLDRDF